MALLHVLPLLGESLCVRILISVQLRGSRLVKGSNLKQPTYKSSSDALTGFTSECATSQCDLPSGSTISANMRSGLQLVLVSFTADADSGWPAVTCWVSDVLCDEQ